MFAEAPFDVLLPKFIDTFGVPGILLAVLLIFLVRSERRVAVLEKTNFDLQQQRVEETRQIVTVIERSNTALVALEKTVEIVRQQLASGHRQ